MGDQSNATAVSLLCIIVETFLSIWKSRKTCITSISSSTFSQPLQQAMIDSDITSI